MALPSPSEVAAKWARNASAAQQDYVDGATRTDKDPTALAIAAIPRMRQRVVEAIDSGKVAAGLRRSGKPGWLAGITEKGATNYGTGVQAAESKFEQRIAPVLSHVAAGQSRLASMPANTDAQRDARLLFFVNHMRSYRPPG